MSTSLGLKLPDGWLCANIIPCAADLIATTNQQDVVESVTVYFRKIIDHSFYNSFVGNYGAPNSIQVIENRRRTSETLIKDETGKTTQTLTKNIFDLREGTFEENPLHIIWEKDDYQIKVFLRHEQSVSEITFSSIAK